MACLHQKTEGTTIFLSNSLDNPAKINKFFYIGKKFIKLVDNLTTLRCGKEGSYIMKSEKNHRLPVIST